MTITLNGAAHETEAATIQALAGELTPAPETLLIELNGTALFRSDWINTPVQEGDKVEILKVAAGG
jgi:sulfur carrier protein